MTFLFLSFTSPSFLRSRIHPFQHSTSPGKRGVEPSLELLVIEIGPVPATDCAPIVSSDKSKHSILGSSYCLWKHDGSIENETESMNPLGSTSDPVEALPSHSSERCVIIPTKPSVCVIDIDTRLLSIIVSSVFIFRYLLHSLSRFACLRRSSSASHSAIVHSPMFVEKHFAQYDPSQSLSAIVSSTRICNEWQFSQ